MSVPPSPAPAAPAALDAWLAHESELRRRMESGPGVGVSTPAQLAGRSGLEMLEAMLRAELPTAPIASTLEFLLVEVEPGRAVFQGQPLAAHFNPMGSIHGGWYATLLDSAMGCAVQTMLPAGRAYTTAELSVNLVRGLSPRVPRVRAEGKVLHCGRQLATAEGRLYGPAGALSAHATTTCLVYEPAGR